MARKLDNYHTRVRRRVGSDKKTPPEEMRRLIERARDHINSTKVFRSKADLNGIVVEYVGNSLHQYEFWKENWWEAPVGVEAHCTIYSASGVEGREPFAYYAPALSTAVFFNTEYYGQCKSWALGMTAAILERKFNTLSIHGALAEYKGKGVIIIAPTGTGKTSQAFKLFLKPGGKILGDDWVFVQFPEDEDGSGPLTAVQPEKSLYMRTETQLEHAWLRTVFDKRKVENVVEDKEICDYVVDEDRCKLTGETCVFDRGYTHCYYSFGNSRAIVPREALLAPEKVADMATVDLVVLLSRDDHSPPEVRLSPEEALEVLGKGEYMIRPGAGPKEMWGKAGYEPYYNPYLLERDPKVQDHYFLKIFKDYGVPRVLLNTGPETVEQTHRRILAALEEN